MATFEEHVRQAERNLKYLEQINQKVEDCIDWQVTACFYIVVHLANAHIAYVEDRHYRSHFQVSDSLNPYSNSRSKIPEKVYVAYDRLKDLSRRSRYLISDQPRQYSTACFETYEVHFRKAMRHLNTFISYFAETYSVNFSSITIASESIKPTESFSFCKIRRVA